MTPEHRMSAVAHRQGRLGGFSLIELIIVMLVAALLVAIAIPLYLNQVRESHRTDARSALLDLAGREERYFATQNTYTNDSTQLGYTTGGDTWPQTVGSGFYQIAQPTIGASPPSYSITATAVGMQANDTACTTLTVNSAGQQTSTGTGSAATCWGQ